MRQTTAVPRADPVRRTRRLEQAFETMAAEVREGLSRRPLPELPCKYFYDERGSALFEAITRAARVLPDPHRERDPRGARRRDRGGRGARRARRARLGGRPQDPPVPRRHALARLARERRPARDQRGLPARLGRPAAGRLPARPRCAGSSATSSTTSRRSGREAGGSCCSSPARSATCTRTSCPRSSARRRPCSLPATASWSGVDLVKDPARLHAAYNDAAGVTAEFNRNILRVLNHRLARRLRPRGLRAPGLLRPPSGSGSRCASARADRSAARVPAAGIELALAAGDEIRTELSCKYTRESLRRPPRRDAASSSSAGSPIPSACSPPSC